MFVLIKESDSNYHVVEKKAIIEVENGGEFVVADKEKVKKLDIVKCVTPQYAIIKGKLLEFGSHHELSQVKKDLESELRPLDKPKNTQLDVTI